MIVATVWQNKTIIMERFVSGTERALTQVISNVESYLIEEKINTNGECLVKVRYLKDS